MVTTRSRTPKKRSPSPAASRRAKKETQPDESFSDSSSSSGDDIPLNFLDSGSDDDELILFEVPDTNDFATKLALRINYGAMLFNAGQRIFFQEAYLADPYNQISVIAGDTVRTGVSKGVYFFGIALLLIAAAQGNFAGQKRALQYLSIWYLVALADVFLYYASGLEGQINDVQVTVIYLPAMIILNCWACYYWKDPEDAE